MPCGSCGLTEVVRRSRHRITTCLRARRPAISRDRLVRGRRSRRARPRARRRALDRIALHVALFQLNAVASLRPDVIDLGAVRALPHARARRRCGAPCFATCGRSGGGSTTCPTTCPPFADAPTADAGARVSCPTATAELLAFCGGGKDSLVALKLLERAELPFATLGYAHSIYGSAAPQHALLDRVAGATRARARRAAVDRRRLPRLTGRAHCGPISACGRCSQPRRRRRCSPRCRSRSHAAIAGSSSRTRRARTRRTSCGTARRSTTSGARAGRPSSCSTATCAAAARERSLLQRARADPRRGDLRAARARRRARTAHALVQRRRSRGAATARSARTCGCSSRRTCRRDVVDATFGDNLGERAGNAGTSASCSVSPSTRRSSASAARPKRASRSPSRVGAVRSARASSALTAALGAIDVARSRPLVRRARPIARHAGARRGARDAAVLDEAARAASATRAMLVTVITPARDPKARARDAGGRRVVTLRRRRLSRAQEDLRDDPSNREDRRVVPHRSRSARCARRERAGTSISCAALHYRWCSRA